MVNWTNMENESCVQSSKSKQSMFRFVFTSSTLFLDDFPFGNSEAMLSAEAFSFGWRIGVAKSLEIEIK